MPTLHAMVPSTGSPATSFQAAGQAFGVLFKGGAGNVMDSVIPSMLMSLEAGGAKASQALEGLRVILGVKPTVLASIVPKLLKPPAASARIRALGSLAEAAGTLLCFLVVASCSLRPWARALQHATLHLFNL